MTGNYNDVVVTSRVRLARNVAGLPYPYKLNDNRAIQLARKVYEAVNKPYAEGQENAEGNDYAMYRMESISDNSGDVLREKHLVSADLLENKKYGAAIIGGDETVSIMVGEEDHIREQCILQGFKLTEAYHKINAIDDAISKSVQFAYDAKLGYLTSCPTNVGTGMRASAMMFLPGLSITRNLEQCVGAVARLHMTIRGVYGEGSEADGYLYQISNQKTLGVSEQEILSSVQSSIGHIADAELRARDELLKANGNALKDRILRAYGVLCHAYMLDSKEFMKLLALVKLGAYYGLIKVSDGARLEKLVTDGQPANIMNLSGKALSGEDRDVFRAGYVAKTLKSICKR
ncbi:MAG: protein arginine kinase [Clostridia bacterium]|nr:protein arginine kinase [Clostridia bacterium]